VDNLKAQLRNKAKEIIVADIAEKTAIIVAKATKLPQFLTAKSVCFYMAKGCEPNLNALIELSFALGKEVFVPITSDIIRLARIDSETQFVSKKFNIKEPLNPCVVDIIPSIMFIPMVAYDSSLTRLGHGKGYYDRFLKDKATFKIGVAFSDFEVEKVPNDCHDISMDIIIADK